MNYNGFDAMCVWVIPMGGMGGVKWYGKEEMGQRSLGNR